ncbi:MAG: corrinoid protein [Desulfotignum sp.]
MEHLEAIKEAVSKGKRKEIAALVQTALDNGADPNVIINEYMIEAMKEVGARFEAKKIFVPEMMISALTMQNGVDVIKPLLEKDGNKSKKLGIVVIGTVFGDLHDIGKNLAILMLESAGFEVHNIGENVSADKFVEKATELNADIIGLSSLLTTGDPYVKETVAAIKNSPLKDKVKVMCGGAAVTEKFSVGECGADGHAVDAIAGVKLAKKFVGVE